jgi:hypothetical protein
MYNFDRLLRWFLLLVAAHTLGVGLVLVIAGSSIMGYFGFPYLESRFFQMQGGVFHLLVPYVYYKASTDPKRYEYLVVFSIAIKCVATIFLFSYYLFIESIVMVLLSGIVDAGMGLIILFLYWKTKSS